MRQKDGREIAHIIMVGQPETTELTIEWVSDELSLLMALERWLLAHDPDVIIGWNVINFDFRLLLRRAEFHKRTLRWGRGQSLMRWRPSGMDDQQGQLILPGRMVLDGIDALKSATFRFERYGLESVAQELLGRGKAIDDPDDRIAEITRLFHHDKPALARYNLEDCRLVLDIFDKVPSDFVFVFAQPANRAGLQIAQAALSRHLRICTCRVCIRQGTSRRIYLRVR